MPGRFTLSLLIASILGYLLIRGRLSSYLALISGVQTITPAQVAQQPAQAPASLNPNANTGTPGNLSLTTPATGSTLDQANAYAATLTGAVPVQNYGSIPAINTGTTPTTLPTGEKIPPPVMPSTTGG